MRHRAQLASIRSLLPCSDSGPRLAFQFLEVPALSSLRERVPEACLHAFMQILDRQGTLVGGLTETGDQKQLKWDQDPNRRAGEAVTSRGPGRCPADPAAALPVRAPRNAAAVFVGAPAADGQTRDELRGQPPRDAPQVQLLPEQGLELPAAALGTTKGRVGTARTRGGVGEGQEEEASGT